MPRVWKPQILGAVRKRRRRSHPWRWSSVDIVTSCTSVCRKTVPRKLIRVPLTIPNVVVHCVDDVMMRRKPLLISLTVEETHRVPFTPNLAQTRSSESKRVAGHLVDCHLPCKGDEIEHHIPKAVSSAVRIEGGVVEVVSSFGAGDGGVEKAPASVHLVLNVILHRAQAVGLRTLIQTEVRYTRRRQGGREVVVVAYGRHCHDFASGGRR